MTKHFLAYIAGSIKSYPDAPALTDYETGENYTYSQMASNIVTISNMLKNQGIAKGDKVALCGRNSSLWATCFLAIMHAEGVAVSIMADFTGESVVALVNHSEAKILFTDDSVLKKVDQSKLPKIITFDEVKSQLTGAKVTDFAFPTDNIDELAIINYTSGTTSDPKGVMLTHRSLSSNVQFAQERLPNQVEWTVISILPLAHMFGMTFEFLYQLAGGCHVYFLGKTPSPQVFMKALKEIQPYMILTVPLVIEKIFRKGVLPKIQAFPMNILWNTPLINIPIRRAVGKKLHDIFGGKLIYLIIGGAALSGDVEDCLQEIKFPFCVGYGMTECGPLLGYEDWWRFAKQSCGKIVDRMEVKIDSSDATKEVGEIMVRGENSMIGYYKNEHATKAVLDTDGWLHTGDLGLIIDGNIFIKGRSKNLILGPSGQNIYPEEIENLLNAQPLVTESVVVSRENRLFGLVYVDPKDAGANDVEQIMEENRVKVNKNLPSYSQIAKIEVVETEFEKTPKRSIKRFLYK